MAVESFRWLATPGFGIAALLLVYDARRVLRPRIAGERPWRETRLLGLVTVIFGLLLLQRFHGSVWLDGLTEGIVVLALGPLVWSWVTLTRLVAEALRLKGDD